jgi:hypothetical protein
MSRDQVEKDEESQPVAKARLETLRRGVRGEEGAQKGKGLEVHNNVHEFMNDKSTAV